MPSFIIVRPLFSSGQKVSIESRGKALKKKRRTRFF